MSHFLYNFVFSIYVLVCITLIVAVSSQTSKNEGLGIGNVGGKVETASFARKKTWEEQLSRVTSFIAWSFLILSTAIVFLGI